MLNRIIQFLIRDKLVVGVLILFVLPFGDLKAQTSQVGIYFTEHQFTTNKPFRLFEVDKEKLPVDLNIHSELIIPTKDSTYTFSFGQLYGFSIRDDRYRGYGKKGALLFYGYYKVIDTAGLIVYSRKVRHGKSFSAPTYYFSRNFSDPILELTLSQLRKAFTENKAFIEKLKPVFKINYHLLIKKNPEGETELNKLFRESKAMDVK